mgnify:CR=1 FL=1|jgi:hypothetical protein
MDASKHEEYGRLFSKFNTAQSAIINIVSMQNTNNTHNNGNSKDAITTCDNNCNDNASVSANSLRIK